MTSVHNPGETMPRHLAAPLTITDSVRYQGASGDMNPMHHDADRARAKGYDDAFTVGMLPAGILARLVAEWISDGEVRRYKAYFRSQVWPGDQLSYDAEVTSVREVDGGSELTITMSVVNQDGVVCLVGDGEWVIPDAR
jgi:acyl dehydratase